MFLIYFNSGLASEILQCFHVFSLSLYLCCRFCRFCRFMHMVHTVSLVNFLSIRGAYRHHRPLQKSWPVTFPIAFAWIKEIPETKKHAGLTGATSIWKKNTNVQWRSWPWWPWHHRTMKMICKRIRLWFGAGGQPGIEANGTLQVSWCMKSDSVKYPFSMSFLSHFTLCLLKGTCKYMIWHRCWKDTVTSQPFIQSLFWKGLLRVSFPNHRSASVPHPWKSHLLP